MNLYKYILSILFPVVLSVLTFSCKEEAGIELFQNLDIVGEVPIQEGSLRCTVLHGGTINVYGGVESTTFSPAMKKPFRLKW